MTVPILWSKSFLHYYDDIKFLIIGIFGALCWLHAAWSKQKVYVHKSTRLLWLIFILTGLLSSYYAINPHKALIMLIWWLILSGISVFSSSISEEDQEVILRKTLLFPALFILAYGYFQIAGYEPFGLPHDNYPVSTLGYKNMVGEFYVLIFPIFFAALIGTFNTRKYFRMVAFLFLNLLILGHLYFSFSRSSLLGLATGIAFFIVIYLIKNRRLNFSFITIFLSSMLLVSFTAPKHHPDPQGENAFTKWTDKSSWTTRITRWNNSAEIIKDRPFFGIGPDNFQEIYPLYATRHHTDPELHENVFVHHTHNEYLQLFVEHGILGGSVFVIFILYFFFLSLVSILNKKNFLMDLGLLSSVVGILMCSFFSFSPRNPVTGFLTAIFIGFLFRRHHKRDPIRQTQLIRTLKPIIASIIIFFISSTAWSQHLLEKAKRERLNVNMTLSLYYSDKAIRISPWQPQYYLFHCSSLVMINDFSSAKRFCSKLTEISPYHYVAFGYLGYIHHQEGHFSQAIYNYQKALKIHPNFKRIQEYVKLAKNGAPLINE